jgi:hypothetical protein
VRELAAERFGSRRPVTRRSDGSPGEPVRVVEVVVASDSGEERLAQEGAEVVADIQARARIREEVGRATGEAERVVEFAQDQQSGVGGDRRAAEFEPQTGVEIEQKRGRS